MDKQAIYNELKKSILTMSLEPGTALDEASLCKRYSISRTPLREILRTLAAEGCVDIVSNRGAYVSSMSHKVLRDFFITAPMIYAAIGRLAAVNAKPEQIARMRDIQAKFRAAIESGVSADMVY